MCKDSDIIRNRLANTCGNRLVRGDVRSETMMFLDGWLCLSRLYACNSRGDGVVDQCETVSLFLMDCHMVRFFKLKKWVSKMYQFLKVDARCRTIFVKMLFY